MYNWKKIGECTGKSGVLLLWLTICGFMLHLFGTTSYLYNSPLNIQNRSRRTNSYGLSLYSVRVVSGEWWISEWGRSPALGECRWSPEMRRTTSGISNERDTVDLSFFSARTRSSPARFLNCPHWQRVWNRLSEYWCIGLKVQNGPVLSLSRFLNTLARLKFYFKKNMGLIL